MTPLTDPGLPRFSSLKLRGLGLQEILPKEEVTFPKLTVAPFLGMRENYQALREPWWRKATCTACVPVDLMSRFCTLLTYICLHIPAVSGFCLGRQPMCGGDKVGFGAGWLYHAGWGRLQPRS